MQHLAASLRLEYFQTSYESGIKELSQEFRVRLQEELTQREAVEKQLEKQVSRAKLGMSFEVLKSNYLTLSYLKVKNLIIFSLELLEESHGAQYTEPGGRCC